VLQPVVEDGNVFFFKQKTAYEIPRIIEIGAGSNYGGGDWLGIRMTEASTLLGIDRIPLFAGFLGLALLAAPAGPRGPKTPRISRPAGSKAEQFGDCLNGFLTAVCYLSPK